MNSETAFWKNPNLLYQIQLPASEMITWQALASAVYQPTAYPDPIRRAPDNTS